MGRITHVCARSITFNAINTNIIINVIVRVRVRIRVRVRVSVYG